LQKRNGKAFNCVFVDEVHKIHTPRQWFNNIGHAVFPMTATPPPAGKRVLEEIVWYIHIEDTIDVEERSDMYRTSVDKVKLAAENGDALPLLSSLVIVDMDPVTEQFQSFMAKCVDSSISRTKVGANKVYSSTYFMPWMLLEHQKGEESSSSSKKRRISHADRFIRKEGYDFVFMNPPSDPSKTLTSMKEKMSTEDTDSFDFFELAKSSPHKIDCDGTRVYVGPYIAGAIDVLNNVMCMESSDTKVVIFTMFTQELELLTFLINSMRMKHQHSGQCVVALGLNGKTSNSEKDYTLDKFRVPDSQERVLILSRTYAKGLNLQAANNIIMLTVDNDVNNDNQAIHRVFRSEQTRSVLWTHVCGRSSVERACVAKKLGKKNCDKADHVGAMCNNMEFSLRDS
jgi:hypothetical protein